ncbi:MAG TPA: CvpA family protein [Thermomicrobiaceae bacterium]|nr:CvpA family protein [Thermomicrobiaceae bacterium]
MSVFVVLDILLLILIALPIPIGFWRGAQREAFVTLGILFGAALSDWWARPWGGDLAAMSGLRDSAGAFMVAMLFLVGATFLLGYGTGAALPMPPSGLIARIFGGLIAGANSALLFSFTLRNIRIFLLDNQDTNFLSHTLLAQFLSTGVGWILMGAAVLFVPIVLALALIGPSTILVEEYEEQPAEDEYEGGFTPVPRRFPPRTPSAGYDPNPIYKTEPARQSYSLVEETRQMAPQPSGRLALANGGIVRSGDEPQVVVARPDHSEEGEPEEAQATRQMPRIEPDRRDEALRDGICPDCHADIRSAEVYCPNCGRVL